MTLVLWSGEAGTVVLPAANLVLVDREDGGHLCVHPPREVWERTQLTPAELSQWSFLVAATARATLETLDALRGGCLNYWEAGNWSLHHEAEPRGPKDPRLHRRVHLHLLGRSPMAKSPSWRWGEAPHFPDFAVRHSWASRFRRLTPEECRRVVAALQSTLSSTYGMAGLASGTSESVCPGCGYPTPGADRPCAECEAAS